MTKAADVPKSDLGPRASEIRAFRKKLDETLVQVDSSDPARLHELLDIILRLQVDAAGNSDGENAAAARELAAVLIRRALDWTRPNKPLSAPSAEALAAVPSLWRLELTLQLADRTNLLPDWLTKPLMASLDQLNDGSGETPSLLPTPRGGHGANPEYARFLERQMLCWIAYQVGRGSKITHVRQKVAEAAGLASTKALESWETDWRKQYPRLAEHDIELSRRRGVQGLSFRDDGKALDTIINQWKLARLPAKARDKIPPTKRT